MLSYFERTLTEYAQILLNSNIILIENLLAVKIPPPIETYKKKTRTYKMGHNSVAVPNPNRRLSGEKQNETRTRTEIS